MEEWKKDEIQTIMRYNWARGLNSSECLIEMQPNTGSDCPNHNLIIQRYKGFDDDLSKAVLTSNSSSVQIDPLKIDVEGQLAKRKQLIYFGLPIESASKTEVITTTKEEFDDSSKNIPINSTVSDCVIEEAVIIKKERHNDEIKEDVNNATTGVELENSVYSEVKDESSIDIVHEIVSSATACHDGSFGIACTNSEVDCNQGGVKIEVIVEDLVPNVHQGYQNKQCSRAITPRKLCIQKDTCKRFACEYCGKTYKNKNHANRHMYYECQVMKMKNKKWKKYLCEECKRFFTSKYSLERHQFFLHSGVSEKVSCGTCRQTFVNVRGLESHLKKKNCGGTSQYHFICKIGTKAVRIAIQVSETDYVIRLGNIQIWKAETLDSSDSTMSAPDVHSESAGENDGTLSVIKCSSGRPSKYDIQSIVEESDNLRPNESSQLTAFCVKCSRMYECDLDTPINFCRECVNPLTYKCQRCQHWYRTFTSARNHRASSCRPWLAQGSEVSGQQSQKLEYPCNKCAYVANSKSTLQRHLVTDHRHKRHVCLACGRFFDTLLEVARHTQIDCEQSALSCAHCHFKCNKKVALFNHIQREHVQIYPDGEFDCRFCGSRRSCTADLRKHEYSCPYIRSRTQ